MQQEQYYKAVPVSDKPKQEGWITVITKEGKQSPYLYTGTDMSFITLREQYTHYLEPIQLPDTSVLRDKMQDILSLKHAVGFMDEDHKTYNQGYNHGLEMAQSIAREALSAGDGSPEYEQSDSCREAEREDWEADREKKIEDVFHWLLGYTDFPQRQEGEGQYYWRTHLREKLKAIGIEIENSPSPPIK